MSILIIFILPILAVAYLLDLIIMNVFVKPVTWVLSTVERIASSDEPLLELADLLYRPIRAVAIILAYAVLFLAIMMANVQVSKWKETKSSSKQVTIHPTTNAVQANADHASTILFLA